MIDKAQDSSVFIKPINATKIDLKSSLKSGIVHAFGIGPNVPVSQITLKDLLLLSFDKGLSFNAAEIGKKTYQNFECHTGNPPVSMPTDEQRVRNALSNLYRELDCDGKKISSLKQPSAESGDVPAWNQKRNEIASLIQEKVMRKLEDLELSVVVASSKKPYKRCTPNVSAVMSRLDKFNVSKREQSSKKLAGSMSSFLTTTSSSKLLPSSLLSSSSSSVT